MDLAQPNHENKDRELLLKLIGHNADVIELKEHKSRIDSEYIAICVILDDLADRPNGREGHLLMMDILSKEYSKHQPDVMTYLMVNYADLKLNAEEEKKFNQRFQ